MPFPEDFRWGAAAAAYQIEGAAREDGKGPSVWDQFCLRPGAVFEGHTGETACDHYHRYAEDVELMAGLGLQAYRLSVSWPRVLPEGVGKANARGLDFYDRLIDALLEKGIEPWVTLFHWDYPLALYQRGGWLNADSPRWMGEYADLMARRLGDRVRHWITLNEPQAFIGVGHQHGMHAPGERLDFPQVLRATHHTLLSHGEAVRALRAGAPQALEIGMVTCLDAPYPADGQPENIEAARQQMFEVPERDMMNSAWWLDPIFRGAYPDLWLEHFRDDLTCFDPAQLGAATEPTDFLGLNVYFGTPVRRGEDGRPERLGFAPGHPRTPMGWPVTPESLGWAARFFHERYGIPLVVTENGTANLDVVSTDDAVHDPQRIDYLRRYLRELERAMEDGADVRGYFLWSILDNFEWAEGYNRRFGIVHVDYETQQRRPKDSARWYAKLIAAQGGTLHED